MNSTCVSVGIWIDHKRAIIVTLREGREIITRIESNVEGRVRLAGGGPTVCVPEGGPEHRHAEHLRLFYRNVIERIENAGSLYILGPGEAKGEFAKEIRKSKRLAKAIVAVESADKMTERQIAAHVRDFFAARLIPAKKNRRR
jgi:hypothetical protein